MVSVGDNKLVQMLKKFYSDLDPKPYIFILFITPKVLFTKKIYTNFNVYNELCIVLNMKTFQYAGVISSTWKKEQHSEIHRQKLMKR